MLTRKSIQTFADTTQSDVVAGLSEVAVNSYASKHQTMFPDVYKGDGTAPPLDLKFEYIIGAPLKFDFTTVNNSADVFKRAILSDPLFFAQKQLFREDLTAPTITATVSAIKVSFYALASGTHLADVDVEAVASVALTVDPAPPGHYSLFVTSVNVHITSIDLMNIEEDVLAGCDINKLIEHILTTVMTDRLRRFLQAFPLPQPHWVVSGIEIGLQNIEVIEDYLVLSLFAKSISVAQESIAELSNNLDSADAMHHSVFGKVPSISINTNSKGDEATGILDLRRSRALVPSQYKSVKATIMTEDAQTPAGDMFVSFSQRLFQLIADKKLNIQVDKMKQSGGWAHYFYRFGYHVYQPTASVLNTGVRFTAEITGYAAGGAGLSGCSSKVKVELGASATADPRVIADANFFTQKQGTELWIWPFAFPFLVIARAWMKPYVPILDFLLSLIVSSLMNLFSAFILPLISLFLRFRLVSLPDLVPGTPVPMHPSITDLGNWEGMLYVSFSMGL